MTGFGAVKVETEEYEIQVEVKTLNSKYLDFNMRPDPLFSAREPEIRSLISQKLVRGKIVFNLNFTNLKALSDMRVNQDVVAHYYQELKKTAEQIDAPQHDLFRIAMLLPNTYTTDAQSCGDEEWKIIRQAIEQAIEKCNEFRAREGKLLQQMLAQSLDTLENLLQKVEEQDPERLIKIREKLKKHVDEFVSHEHFDSNRFEQELIYYIEKLDIAEEKTRLRSHLPYFREILEKPADSHGKKLNFIAQEIGREINTIGSKANDVQIQHLVVNMKEELEKIKEQISNVI